MKDEARRTVAKLRIVGSQLQHDGVESLNFDYSQNVKNSCTNLSGKLLIAWPTKPAIEPSTLMVAHGRYRGFPLILSMLTRD